MKEFIDKFNCSFCAIDHLVKTTVDMAEVEKQVDRNKFVIELRRETIQEARDHHEGTCPSRTSPPVVPAEKPKPKPKPKRKK